MSKERIIESLEYCRKNQKSNDCESCEYGGRSFQICERLVDDILVLLKEQEPRILSLEEAIEGKNGLEIDPYVFVEIKGREDIFIGEVNDASHYNYPNLIFGVGECFQINRSFQASKKYLNTDYMKTVRCWTHKPSKEQREAVKWGG